MDLRAIQGRLQFVRGKLCRPECGHIYSITFNLVQLVQETLLQMRREEKTKK